MNREEFGMLLNKRGLKGISLELGVKKGNFSEALLSCWDGDLLVLVDSWREIRNASDASSRASYEEHRKNLNITLDKINMYDDKVVVIRGYGNQVASLFKDESLDFIYIDAQHTYKEVMNDLECWYPKIKSGGIIAGHDYWIEEVKQAVNNFFNFTINTTDEADKSWWVVKL